MEDACAVTVKRVELVLETLASGGAGLLCVDLRPEGWTVRYRDGGLRSESFDHVAPLASPVDRATADALTPILLRRWSLGPGIASDRAGLWRWLLPKGCPPSHDGQPV